MHKKMLFQYCLKSVLSVVSLLPGTGQCEGHHIFPLIPSPLAMSKLLEVSGLCSTVLIIALSDWKIHYFSSGLLLILFPGVMTAQPSLSTIMDTPHCCHAYPLVFLSFCVESDPISLPKADPLCLDKIPDFASLCVLFRVLSTDVAHHILFLLHSCSWVTCLLCSNCLLLLTLCQYLLQIF